MGLEARQKRLVAPHPVGREGDETSYALSAPIDPSLLSKLIPRGPSLRFAQLTSSPGLGLYDP